MCGTGTEYVVTGDIIPSINGVYKIYDPTCYGGFDGNICWQIVRTQSGGNLDCSTVVFGTNYGNCESCPTAYTLYQGCGSGYYIAVFAAIYYAKANIDYNDGINRTETCYLVQNYPATLPYDYIGTNAVSTNDPCE
jgi:hypothetical protein